MTRTLNETMLQVFSTLVSSATASLPSGRLDASAVMFGFRGWQALRGEIAHATDGDRIIEAQMSERAPAKSVDEA